MSKAVIVTDEEFARLKGMLSQGVTVIVPEFLAKKYGEETVLSAAADYDCGGDADVWVDLVDGDDHYFISSVEGGRR